MHKALYNIALNPLSAIFQVPYGRSLITPIPGSLAEQMIREAFHGREGIGSDMGISRDNILTIL